MAEFEVRVYKLKIEEHPNADALEIARVGDYRSIVQKGQYKTGDLGVYIPEQSILPQWLISRLGLEGRLAGSNKDRVKAIKLRGVLSQGIVYQVFSDSHIELCQKRIEVSEGDVVTEELGITKYEPIIPASMSGEVEGCNYTIKFDIENIKKYPDIFEPGEYVVITEKLHGTWCCFGSHPDYPYIVTSKGLSGRGLIFQIDTKNTESNLYVRTLEETRWPEDQFPNGSMNLIDRAHMYFNRETGNPMLPFYILGEIFGRGVQDLHYGQKHPSFRIFDIYVGEPGQGRYLNYQELVDFANDEEIMTPLVPVLAVVDYDKDIVEDLTNGKDTICGANVREGVVIKAVVEREHNEIGRVCLKSVSEAYLLRKGGTEFN